MGAEKLRDRPIILPFINFPWLEIGATRQLSGGFCHGCREIPLRRDHPKVLWIETFHEKHTKELLSRQMQVR
jgi:hypothetical protein